MALKSSFWKSILLSSWLVIFTAGTLWAQRPKVGLVLSGGGAKGIDSSGGGPGVPGGRPGFDVSTGGWCTGSTPTIYYPTPNPGSSESSQGLQCIKQPDFPEGKPSNDNPTNPAPSAVPSSLPWTPTEFPQPPTPPTAPCPTCSAYGPSAGGR